MSLDGATLYRLLPAVYRIRDELQQGPLQDLLALIARELSVIEENIEQLYDDQFIETCAPWVVPYIGDLIGYRSLHAASAQIASPRRDVANTIQRRRGKGTTLMLEQLAFDVTAWPAHAAEFFEQLATTQYMNHTRLHAVATAAVRSQAAMLARGTAFNRVAHTVEVRRPQTGAGRYNIPNVGIFLWRLQPFRLHDIPLTPDPADATGRRFRMNPLGADLALFRRPQTETTVAHLAEPMNVPAPLAVRELALQCQAATNTIERVEQSDDYGTNRSVVISRAGIVEPLRVEGASPPDAPDEQRVVRIADLRDVVDSGGTFIGWAHEEDLAPHQIGIDPERGRVLLGVDRVADHAAEPFTATFHYASARAIGGGPYERVPEDVDATAIQRSAVNSEALQPHLDAIASGGRLLINDSRVYSQSLMLRADGMSGATVVIAARNGARPLLAAAPTISLSVSAGSTLVLDGLVIAGSTLRLEDAGDGEPRTLVLRDCTLVPGLSRLPDGSPATPEAPSLVIDHPFTTVRLERCVVGPLHSVADADVTFELSECIVDASSPDRFAHAAAVGGGSAAQAVFRDCTIIGKVHARLLQLVSNTLFFARRADADPPITAPVLADRRQEGCVRFSYVPPGSITPRRHRCVPDAANPDVLPHFTSLRYGDPGYAQLRSSTSAVIRTGADDEGEMGVMHSLYQPQREANLRIRLDEYLRFGLQAGLFYAT